MAFSKLEIVALHKDLDAVLKQFAEKHNLVVGQFPIKYSANDFSCTKITFSSKNANPDAIDPRFLMDLRRRGFMHGLDASMVGTMVKTSKGMMKFVGMRASKAAVKDADGKIWLYDATLMATLVAGNFLLHQRRTHHETSVADKASKV
jgi:hypothetical protein